MPTLPETVPRLQIEGQLQIVPFAQVSSVPTLSTFSPCADEIASDEISSSTAGGALIGPSMKRCSPLVLMSRGRHAEIEVHMQCRQFSLVRRG